ncbi:hypothetical protein Vretifemale_4825, partial [Volvox reticuliferus]
MAAVAPWRLGIANLLVNLALGGVHAVLRTLIFALAAFSSFACEMLPMEKFTIWFPYFRWSSTHLSASVVTVLKEPTSSATALQPKQKDASASARMAPPNISSATDRDNEAAHMSSAAVAVGDEDATQQGQEDQQVDNTESMVHTDDNVQIRWVQAWEKDGAKDRE